MRMTSDGAHGTVATRPSPKMGAVTSHSRGRQALQLPPAVRLSRHVRGEGPSLVLHALSTSPVPLRHGEIVDRVDLAATTVTKILASLEESGVVTADLPRGQRLGKTVYYSVDRAHMLELLHGWLEYITGSAPDATDALRPHR